MNKVGKIKIFQKCTYYLQGWRQEEGNEMKTLEGISLKKGREVGIRCVRGGGLTPER